MDLNTIIFGGMAVLSLAVFFYFGRFKASREQIERDDRIDWTVRRFSLWKILLYSLGAVAVIAVLSQLF